jgi:hypothetical protein
MKQHFNSPEVARTLLQDAIVELESKSAKLREERLKQQASEEVLRCTDIISTPGVESFSL